MPKQVRRGNQDVEREARFRDHRPIERNLSARAMQINSVATASFADDVDQRSQWRGHAYAVNSLDLSLVELGVVQTQYVRNGRHPPEPGRHRHIQLRRHHVGEIVQCHKVAGMRLWYAAGYNTE